ncbi:hypothetical protein [Sphaerisporangium dianthi]|uniref:YtkA-like domain-containing protein n=1 Tax=Sphaerisporangium dianthi TaxID=1436120 RepID=A0ABV9CQ64_9ACTN
MRRLLIMVVLAAAIVALVVAGRSRSGPVRLRATGAHYSVTVTLDEPAVHPVAAEVRVEPGTAGSVWLSAVMPAMGHATPEITARRQGPGRFTATGRLFTMAGVWELSVRVRGAAGEEVVVVSTLVTG